MEPATALLLHLFCSVCAGLYTSTPSPHPPQVSTPSVWEQPGSEQSECSLQVEPPELVVRFGDPVSVSCSNSQEAVLGWEGLQEPTEPVMGAFLSWTEESLSRWDIEPKCYALTVVGQCALNLSLTVYQPPNSVSLSFRDQGVEVDGLLLMADSLYTLHCEVEAVAPAELLTVRFYRNHKELGSRSGQSTLKSPVNQSLSLDYRLSREDHRALFYCEASLELGPGGPQPGPLLRSQNITVNVHFSEEQVEAPPTTSSMEHSGIPTMFAQSQRGQNQHREETAQRQHPEETAQRQHPEETAQRQDTAQRQHPEDTAPKGAGLSLEPNALVALALLLFLFTHRL